MDRAAKRALDLLLAIIALTVSAPVFLACAIAIAADSKGPILYRGRRIGQGGKPFSMLKFRTLVVDAEQIGGSSTPDDDPRITRVGAILRKRKLDELPQLWNVLRGDMSFVGPRPQVEWAVQRYSAEERHLLDVKPGITDYASLKFPNEGEILKGSADPDRDYMEKIHPEKVRLGLYYVRHRTILGDVRIIAQTLFTVLRREDRD